MRVEIEKAFQEDAWGVYVDGQDAGTVTLGRYGYNAVVTVGEIGTLRSLQVGAFETLDMAVGAVAGVYSAQQYL